MLPTPSVTAIGMGAGVIYSRLGGTHHSIEDVAVAGANPTMTVLAPCDPAEMRHMTRWCATQSQGPVYMRLGKAEEPDLTASAIDPFEVGEIRYLQRGTDVVLISNGITVASASKVAAKLEALGKTVSVLSCHTIKPLDRAGVEQVLASHKQVAVIEEYVPHGGLGSQIKESAWDSRETCRPETFSLQGELIHCYGTNEEFLRTHGLSVENVLEELL